MATSQFTPALWRALRLGLAAAALVDRDGRIVDLAGEFEPYDTNALAGLATVGLVGEELADRMLAGESVQFTLGAREALISIAGQAVFVVAILGPSPSPEHFAAAQSLHDHVEYLVQRLRADALRGGVPIPGGGSGGPPGSGELPVIEIGVTRGLRRAKA